MIGDERRKEYLAEAKAARDSGANGREYWLEMAGGMMGYAPLSRIDRENIAFVLYQIGKGVDPKKVFATGPTKRGVQRRGDWAVIAKFAIESTESGSTYEQARLEAADVFSIDVSTVARYISEWRDTLKICDEVRLETLEEFRARGLVGSDGLIRD